jgi:hypothetical protein
MTEQEHQQVTASPKTCATCRVALDSEDFESSEVLAWVGPDEADPAFVSWLQTSGAVPTQVVIERAGTPADLVAWMVPFYEDADDDIGEEAEEITAKLAALRAGLTEGEKPEAPTEFQPAHRFLELLGKDPDKTWFRTLKGGKANPTRSGRDLRGLNVATLTADNKAGEAVYFVTGDADHATGINKKGRPTSCVGDPDITCCRAVFVEWDTQPIEWQLKAWQELNLPEPSLMVRTGGKSIHCYWLLTNPMEPQQWRVLQERLITHAGGDQACKNPSRLMRLPGFYYIDKETGCVTDQMAELIHQSDATYSATEIEACLQQPIPAEKSSLVKAITDAAKHRSDLPPRSDAELLEALRQVPEFFHNQGRRDELLRLAQRLIVEWGAERAQQWLVEHSPSIQDMDGYFSHKPDHISPGSIWPFLRERYGVDLTRHDLRKDVKENAATGPMPPDQYMAELRRIKSVERNPAVMYMEMERFAASQGDYRKTGPQLERALIEYDYFEDCSQRNRKLKWWQSVDEMKFVVPGLMKKPTSILLHAAGGVGKTQTAMALAKSVGKSDRMMVRGIEVEFEKGNVLWIQNDQSLPKLIQDCENQGIDVESDTWFVVKRGFQLNHTHQFAEWVREHKPVLVVVDSITSCSTKMQVAEKDSAFAAPFYHYSEKNGDPGPEGFPATTIVWIHHDNAAGDARGNKLLVAAIDEQWHLRKPKETEHGPLQGQGHKPAQCRMVQIKKSRLGREGDLLVVERDANYTYSVADFTPTQRHEDDGNGDPEADTMTLQIVKDYALEARESGKDDGMTVREVWDCLSRLMFGQAREAPAQRTVERWLKRWETEGLLVAGVGRKTPGAKKPSRTFTIPRRHTPPTRGGTDQTCHLSFIPSNPLQENGSNKRQASDVEERVVYSDPTRSTAQGINDTALEGSSMSFNEIPVVEGDLREETTNGIQLESTRAREEAVSTDKPVAMGDWEEDGWVRPMGKWESLNAVTDFDGCVDVTAMEVP